MTFSAARDRSDAASAPPTPLTAKLIRRIVQDGPMTVAEFMLVCLHDPQHGYYATRPTLGADGDFITAPLVSQMFGELVGAWLADLWRQTGAPSPFRLVELGPGDGTLAADVLRSTRAVTGFHEALELWLVEPSRPLRALQEARLAGAAPRFSDRLEDVSAGAPMLLYANEVFDCLPVRQFVRAGGRWAERRIGLEDTGRLTFGLAPPPGGVELPPEAPEGVVVERSPAQTALAASIGGRIARDGGAALIFDYGEVRSGFGDTLQAVSAHCKVDALMTAGEADLTVHVDFGDLAAAARAEGAATSPITTQGRFLEMMGVKARAARLAQGRPDLAPTIARQLERLTAPDQMGRLFKVLAMHSPGLDPPGFAQDAA